MTFLYCSYLRGWCFLVSFLLDCVRLFFFFRVRTLKMLQCYLVDYPSCGEKIPRLFSQQEYPVYIIKTWGIFELISKKIQSAGQYSSSLAFPNIIQSKALAQATRRKKILSPDDEAASRHMCLKVLVPPPAFHHSLHLHRLTLICKTLQPCCVKAEM